MINIKNLYPLPDFSWSETNSRPVDQNYFDYYGLSFNPELQAKVSHHFGKQQLADYSIATHYFQLENNKGSIVLVHGYMDHVGLYHHLIRVLLHAGYNVLTYDLPGHGLSSGEQAGISSFADYQKVLSALMQDAHEILPRPRYLLGQSTGGSIAMDYVMNNIDHGFDKMVLLAPLVIPQRWSWIQFKILLLGKLLRKIPRKFVHNSSDEVFLDFLKNKDPLQTRYLAVSWGKALQKWQQHFADCQPAGIATLVLQGEKDVTVEWRYNLNCIAKKFPHSDEKCLEGVNHHMVNESEEYRQQIFSALLLFISS